MTRGTISIYLFIPLKVTVYTSRLEKLKHDCARAQSTHVCLVQQASLVVMQRGSLMNGNSFKGAHWQINWLQALQLIFSLKGRCFKLGSIL